MYLVCWLLLLAACSDNPGNQTQPYTPPPAPAPAPEPSPPPPPPGPSAIFIDDVNPILLAHCSPCHNSPVVQPKLPKFIGQEQLFRSLKAEVLARIVATDQTKMPPGAKPPLGAVDLAVIQTYLASP